MIAELGVNFYDTAREENISVLDAAMKYINEAKRAGADAVKFQSYKADTIVSKNSPAYWDTTKEPTKTQYELFLKFDKFNKEDYEKLWMHCKKMGIDFMATPFDCNSADYLNKMVDIFKISSSDLSNLPFIEYVAKKGKPVFLSVGASYLSEIEEAVKVIKNAGCKRLCLLHCVLSYPCKSEDANLNMIQGLQRVFPDLEIGYSDHTLPDEHMIILSTAYLLGAVVIEKHFTLDKSLPGNDHYHAGNPDDFIKARNNFKLIDQIKGKTQKTVLPCEEVPRREARRSLVLARDMKKDEIICKEDIIIKRPGTGIQPCDIKIVIGRKLKKDLLQDTILTWDMI